MITVRIAALSTALAGASALLAACSAPPPVPVVSVPPGAVIAVSAPVHAPPPTVPPRRALFLKGPHDGTSPPDDLYPVWRVEPEGTPPRDLGFTVKSHLSGRLHMGDDHPKLSPAGDLIAYEDDGNLVLRAMDGSPPERITSHAAGEVELLLGGWSPDGSLFLFHKGEVQADDGPPLPRDVQAGFYLMETASRRVTFAPSIESFDAWAPDSRHLLVEERTPDRKTALMAVDIQSGQESSLHEIGGNSGFGQLSTRETWIAYWHDYQLFVSGADGSGRREVTQKGAWAEYQFPKIAPGGARVAYTHRESTASKDPNDDTLVVEIAEPGAKGAPVRVPVVKGHMEYEWESATQLLVLEEGRLWRVGLGGKKTAIATDVGELVVAQ